MIEFLKQLNQNLFIINSYFTRKRNIEMMNFVFKMREEIKNKIKELENEN